jgi:hypothetical protein
VVLSLPECSLCGCPLESEGGTVLFTDHRGIPFEVCEKCTGSVDLLHGSSADEEKARALDYISGCAENIENRGVYDELMRFVEGEIPELRNEDEGDRDAEIAQEEPPQAEEIGEVIGNELPVEEPSMGEKKRRGTLWAVVGVAVVVFLVLAYVLFGVTIG